MLIGITGKSESGKSLASEHLKNAYHFKRMAFAAPLKSMLSAIGVPYNHLWGDKKEQPMEMFGGLSAREAMQRLGTEWGRHNFGESFWTDIWKNEYLRERELHPYEAGYVVDDVRFDSECKAIREMGGKNIEIRRPTLEITGMKYKHASETGVKKESLDYVIWNDGTPQDLRDKIDVLMWQDFGFTEQQGQLV